MGREIRMVPPNWQHPETEEPNHRLGIMRKSYHPLRNQDAETAWADWSAEYARWLGGEFARIRAKYGEAGYPADEPYRSFCAWHGQPPDPEFHRPKWKDGEATWVQVYETVSEGTPVTPPFATKEELVDYLVANGDFWDQRRRADGTSGMPCGPWERGHAEAFVNRGWAPSMVVTSTPGQPVEIKTARDGI